MSACTLYPDDVGFRYKGGHDALANVTLKHERGIVGLLGPNGAGKSTLMHILATLAKPTRGSVHWNGEDTASRPDPLRRTLGYLPQDFGIYPMLSAREFIAYLSAVKGVSAKSAAARVDACLAQVGLADVADRRLGELSGGMRQRVGIAQALLNDPKLLFHEGQRHRWRGGAGRHQRTPTPVRMDHVARGIRSPDRSHAPEGLFLIKRGRSKKPLRFLV